MATKRAPVTADHEEKSTLSVDVNLPGHDARGAATSLFSRTRKQLIERERGQCWLTGLTAKETGVPLEAHHWPIERCFAERVDWPRFSKQAQAGKYGPNPQAFDWVAFFVGCRTIIAPDTGKPFVLVRDPYEFVDNMLYNGRLLAKEFHVHVDSGIHDLPEAQWLAQGYLAEGFKFNDFEIIHHAQEDDMTPTPTPAPVPTPTSTPDSTSGGDGPDPE